MPQASRLRLVVARAHAAGPATGRRRRPDAGTRGPLGRRFRRHDQRVEPGERLLELYSLPVDRVHVAEPGVDAADSRTGYRDRQGAALRCGGDPRQGARRAARCARDDDGPVVALRVRGQPGPRPGVRRRSPSPRTGRRDRRPRALRGAADRSRPRAQLRRRGPARAGVARRDLRHGRHRGAGPRPAGRRSRGRRGDRGPRSRRRRDPARAARSARRSCGARRRAAGVARRRRAAGLSWRRAARERRASLSGWSTTTSVLAGVLAEAAR